MMFDGTDTKIRNRTGIVLAVLVAVVLAGCAGGGGSGGADTTVGEPDSTTEAMEGTATTAVTGSTSGDGADTTVGEPDSTTEAMEGTATAAMTGSTSRDEADRGTAGSDGSGDSSYSFNEGEYYRLNASNTSGVPIEFEVVGVEGQEATVDITYTPSSRQGPNTTTLQGDLESLMRQSSDLPAASIIIALARYPMRATAGQTLSEGKEFTTDAVFLGGPGGSRTPGSEPLSVSVTGTDTVNGIDCSTTEINRGGQVRYTACVNQSLAFAPRITLYDANTGEPQEPLVIEEYRPG